MGRIKSLERQIQDLSDEELIEFRRWFAAFDAKAWDSQFEADVRAGKLEPLADRAQQAHKAGRTTKL